MVDCAPWPPQAAAYVAAANYQVTYAAHVLIYPGAVHVTATTLELTVDWQARRTPYVKAQAVVGWPAPGKLASFDPRTTDLRLAVLVGYKVLTTGIIEQYEVARLRVTDVDVDYTARKITLDAVSDDGLLGPNAILTERTPGSGSTYVAAIQTLVADAFPGEVLTWSLADGAANATFPASDKCLIGDDLYDTLIEYCDAAKLELRHDGLGVWRLDRPTVVPGGTLDGNLTVGRNGTITGLRVRRSRAETPTDVLVRWDYQATGAGTTAVGYGRATTGNTPRTVIVSRRTKKPPAEPGAVASKILARGLKRGDAYEVTSAPMLWLRPRDTVNLTVPGGSTIRGIVERVSLNMSQAEMIVDVQAPPHGAHDRITSSGTGSYVTP